VANIAGIPHPFGQPRGHALGLQEAEQLQCVAAAPELLGRRRVLTR
jgi:hypothetical protein